MTPTSELEARGEKFKFRYDPELQIMFIKMWGAHELEDAMSYKQAFFELAERVAATGPISLLVDCREQTRTAPKAQKLYTEISKHPRSGNSAILGAKAFLRVVVTFISVATRRENIRCFATEEEGLRWLQSKMSA